jgi:NAD(P)H-quinone oxidoreductase subunit 5
MSPYLLPLLAPAALALAALAAALRLPATLRLAEAAAALAALVALGALGLLWARGPGGAGWAGPWDLGLTVRLDAVSATMLLLVAFVGWVVLRYTATALAEEPGGHAFAGWLALALAAVLLLVQAGNLGQLALGWIAAGMAVHRLLLFYPGRVAARRAARKKAITARGSALALVVAAVLLVWGFGTADIARLNEAASGAGAAGGASAALVWAAGFLALAAVLKSAQFPMHGWLTEVMEAPTPVSALLHAGVINAGGFLLIRMAGVMTEAPAVLAGLVLLGGFTALFGGLVMLTQPAVKTALAWSTVAQMGFMVLQCGLGLWALALLHVVAHSLYKAHAFLSAGGAVGAVAAVRRPGPVAVPGPRAVARAFVIALAIYALAGGAAALALGPVAKAPQAVALGAILIFGIAYLLAQGLAEAAPRALTRRIALWSLAASIGYLGFQAAALGLAQGTLPPPPLPGPLEWALIVLALASFGTVAVAQAMFPLWSAHPAAAGLRVHLANGLYANAIFDRLTGGWSRS